MSVRCKTAFLSILSKIYMLLIDHSCVSLCCFSRSVGMMPCDLLPPTRCIYSFSLSLSHYWVKCAVGDSPLPLCNPAQMQSPSSACLNKQHRSSESTRPVNTRPTLSIRSNAFDNEDLNYLCIVLGSVLFLCTITYSKPLHMIEFEQPFN